MSFSSRLSNGWDIFKQSFKVLKANKDLILFPILSGSSMMLVITSFSVVIFAANNWDASFLDQYSVLAKYSFLFIFYLVNYFIVVFFNMALIHCSRAYLRGEEVVLRDGINFSMQHIGAIFSWAVFAATVGTILKVIQENTGIIGKIITGIIGIVWSITTFFVVPVIAYENVTTIGAFRRSSQIMKEKWGESLAGNFSFGLIQFIAILCTALPLYFLGSMLNPVAGIALALFAILIIISVVSATKTIFIGAVYESINGEATEHFDQNLIDDLFVRK